MLCACAAGPAPSQPNPSHAAALVPLYTALAQYTITADQVARRP
jgi:hypothetical protein